MNTLAPLTGRPPRAVIRTRTVIGAVRLVTGFGENCTDATTRRSPAAFRSPTGIPPLEGGGGWFDPTTPVGFEIAEVEPRSLRAMTRTRIVLPESASRTS